MSNEFQPELYQIADVTELLSPSLIFFRDLIQHNLEEMVRISGHPERLRPHVKTHKTREIVEMQQQLGIVKHKCATIAEAEMLANTGADDIMIAYQMVGPNQLRFLELIERFPQVRFMTIVDCIAVAESLSTRLSHLAEPVELLLDLDSGMQRTGIEPSQHAIDLYELLDTLPGVCPGGLHWYDGHHRQSDLQERQGMVTASWNRFVRFRDQLSLTGLPIPRVVAAGTGSFPILAEQPEPNLELSPGTTVLYDADMAERFPEMNFLCAAGILTRVVSKPQLGHMTLDLGHKSCAADQPAGDRLRFPELPDAREVRQTEEHLVIQSDECVRFNIGDTLIAIPRHACPTSAVHDLGYVVENGKVTNQWAIAARGRQLTI